ncbi:MAG: hypothetical protein SV375_00570 [Thermodesulfobacteriota bacterium]|nr:hypothetical protein [Thermodesulfobacteriota bacterium]
MTSLLMLFIVCLDKTLFKKIFWLSGIIFGVLVSIKITSFLLILPVFILFIIWNRDHWKSLWPRILIICMTGILVFYVLNPDWWFSPLSRCKEFLVQSLTRRDWTHWTPFTVYFGGQFYSYRGPFSYPFTMFFITTPILHILLMLSGIMLFFMQKDKIPAGSVSKKIRFYAYCGTSLC